MEWCRRVCAVGGTLDGGIGIMRIVLANIGARLATTVALSFLRDSAVSSIWKLYDRQ